MKSSIPMTFGEKTTADFSFSKSRVSAAYKCALHWHECFEIIHIKSGSLKILLSEGEIILNAGDVLMISPRVLHGVEANGGGCDFFIYGYTEQLIYNSDISLLNMKYLAPFKYGKIKYVLVSARDSSSSEIRSMLDQTMAIHDEQSLCPELRVRSQILIAHSFFYSYSANSADLGSYTNEYITKAELYIREHICEDISPKDIAAVLHVSYSHLARILRTSLSSSAVELINSIKIAHSVQMMTENPESSITDIANALGFSNVSYFSKKFTKEHGMLPSQYIRALRNSN